MINKIIDYDKGVATRYDRHHKKLGAGTQPGGHLDPSRQLLKYHLVRGTHAIDRPSYQSRCARRLLSSYTVAELGMTLYMRCRRLLAPPADPARAKAVPKGKPGYMTAQERREYATWRAIFNMERVIDADRL